MSEKSKRVHRLAELIQTVIAQLLQREVNDPRLNGVTITGVDLSHDGKRAVVCCSLLDVTDENIKLASTAFRNASGFFRFNLSRMTELRHTPIITFHYDASLAVAERVTRLINEANS